MQGEGKYSISDFIESLSPLTLSYQSPTNGDNIWTFWSKEDDNCPQTISSSSSSCKFLASPYSLFHSDKKRDRLHEKTGRETPCQQWEIKEYIKSALCSPRDLTHFYGSNFLVQFWAHMTTGGRHNVLTTSNQPFGLQKIERRLCEYRKHCMSLEFSTAFQDEDEDDEFRGRSVIERVFRNKQMESTPNVRYYSIKDYPQLEFAVECDVWRSLALPVLEPYSWECVGVLELVEFGQYQYFPTCLYSIAEDILKHSPLKALLPFDLQIKGGTEDKVLQEIDKALQEVCTTHQLPFAQIWIPCWPSSAMDYVDSSEKSSYLWCINRLPDIFHVNDVGLYFDLVSFKGVCNDHLLRKGQGVVGKALLSRKPCFCRDISQLPITEYPLSHYARYYGLTGCFAICLQTSLAKNQDYVVEFFLPRGHTISGDPRTFLESILGTVKRHLQGFEIGSGEESYVEVLNISIYDEPNSFRICQTFGIQHTSESLQNEREEVEVQNNVTGEAVVLDDDDGRNVFGAEHNDVAPACIDKRVEMLEEGRENEVAEELFVGVAKTDMNAEITTIFLPPSTESLQNEREVVQLSDDETVMEAGRKNEVNVVISEQNGVAVTSSERISSREETSEREYRTEDSLNQDGLKQNFGEKLDDAVEILGVSRSPRMPACRVNGITKWPSPKRKKLKPSPSNLKHINEFVQGSGGGAEQIPKFSYNEPSDQPPMHATCFVPQAIPNVKAKQDEGNVTIKATFRGEMIRFRLPFSSKKAELTEKVTQRLPLKEGTFNIKYEDADGYWVLIACDEDLEKCIGISKSKSIIRMLVEPITNEAP